jgi:hypothetical protein
MPPVLALLLLILACGFFLAAALNVSARINLLGAGLACWVLVQLLSLAIR